MIEVYAAYEHRRLHTFVEKLLGGPEEPAPAGSPDPPAAGLETPPLTVLR